nr:MAG TPA: hypothetical protein [Caudoviricetes sp.]
MRTRRARRTDDAFRRDSAHGRAAAQQLHPPAEAGLAVRAGRRGDGGAYKHPRGRGVGEVRGVHRGERAGHAPARSAAV